MNLTTRFGRRIVEYAVKPEPIKVTLAQRPGGHAVAAEPHAVLVGARLTESPLIAMS